MFNFNKLYQGARWLGDRAKQAVKWVGDNKDKVKSTLNKIADYSVPIGGAATALGFAPIGGAILGAGRGAKFVSDNLDKGIDLANRGLQIYDKVNDGIQKGKKIVDRGRQLVDGIRSGGRVR